ncbi:aldehyde dehydrogenase family protein [Streptomyces werraensis]|uniref:aldehyde dehydrogenase family protein n=1 Tax=Streptomyces werraensis TaxID=68284 RepID=UPI0037D034AA
MPTTEPERVPDPGAAGFPVVDPATGEAFDEAPDQQPGELDTVIDRAQRAWSGWRADPAARTTALRAAADAVEAAGEDLARSLTREQGKPLAESHAEVARTAARLRYFADIAPRTRPIDDGRPVRSEVRWRSLGPVAAIVPWNFPLQLAASKFAPALAAGNTVVLKPSPFTPLATRMLGSVLAAVLPEDVLTVVTGREPLGARLVSHPGFRHVTFTGSVSTGRAVARAAADGPGYFFAPTVLVDVPPDSPVVTGEQFGPVLPVLPYRSLDEAVEAANGTGFGLGGSVWGTDLDRAEAVAERLDCGTAWVNHHAELSLAQPFAGVKDSGVGVAGGPWGLYGNLQPFVVHRPREA